MDTSHRPPTRLAAWLDRQIATLYPGCFALVMATGIISNALFHEQYRLLSDLLFAVNLVAYPTLIVFTLLRVMRFRAALWSDLINPRLVFSFFSIVAGTDVFGAGVALRGGETAVLLLWLFALAAWLALIYFSFGVLIFLNSTQGANVVHGGWLIAIVGTESLVVLGTVVAPALGDTGPLVFVFIHVLWGVGLGLYAIFIVLFAHRIFFFDVKPDDISPLLWVVMGAAAISTNAGSALILTDSGMPFLASMRPFVDGMTLMIWGWATWWIPLLVVLGVWKHVAYRVPITYTPMLWSLVFPLGMYALATRRLALAADFPLLQGVSLAMVWIALAAWGLTAAGFVHSAWRSYRLGLAETQLPAGS